MPGSFTQAEESIIEQAMAVWSGEANVTFQYVTPGSTTVIKGTTVFTNAVLTIGYDSSISNSIEHVLATNEIGTTGIYQITKEYISYVPASLDTATSGTVRNSVCGRAIEHYAAIALMKRSPKITANWALAMDHSRGGIFHSFSDRFKIR